MNDYRQYADTELVLQLSESDHDAFTEIYNRYWRKLYYLAFKHLRSSELAEETVQDTFLNLWRKRSSIRIENLPFYLAAMTRYAVYRQLSKLKKVVSDEVAETVEMVSDPSAMDDRLLLQLVEKLAHTLPEKCRLVFIYNKLLDQPLSDVAQQLNISQKTAEAHLTKALKAIRGKLGDQLSCFLFL